MLKQFSVKGFKNFDQKICLNLGDARNYEFNNLAVKDGIIKTGLIYGPNSSGKSNLGYAIFDIISTLTDKMASSSHYSPYLSLVGEVEKAQFDYVFQFDSGIINYSYAKKEHNHVIQEELSINGNIVISYDNGKTFLNLPGAENLNLSLYDGNISFVKYVYRNTSLNKHYKIVQAFYKFINFVEHMLLFKSLKINEYIGLTIGSADIIEYIITNNKVKDFQEFLHKFNIEYILEPDIISKKKLYCKFGQKYGDFIELASTGTHSIMLFYYWYSRIQEASFVFIDEFDAFYHSDVSKLIVSMMRDLNNIQVILTSHNTDIMTNSLLRPDCYFVLNEGVVKSIVNCTDKELRVAHNLQKMYKAGAFNG